jgi:hypothetical protein
MDQVDGTQWLLWHLGGGEFMDYKYLLDYVLKWQSSGMSKQAAWQSRENMLRMQVSSRERQSPLTYQNFTRACNGFARSLKLDKQSFVCPNCTDRPRFINADGVCVAPAKRHLEGMEELNKAPNDNEILERGSRFKDRIYLKSNKERKLVLDLLTGGMNMDEFTQTDRIKTEEGRHLQTLVGRISQQSPLKIPDQYVRFLRNVSKATPVAGLLQPTEKKSLILLMKFAKKQLPLRNAEHSEEMLIVQKDLPVFWNILLEILTYENLEYLPDDISKVVRDLLRVRNNTFAKAATRTKESYFDWEDQSREHPTSYYPAFPILTYPKQYQVANKTDENFCSKSFSTTKDFAPGIFTVGK